MLSNVMPCCQVKVHRRFGGRVSQANRFRLLLVGCILGLSFNTEDEGSMFLRNFGERLECTELHLRRRKLSQSQK
jgi:hypothetical protein